MRRAIILAAILALSSVRAATGDELRLSIGQITKIDLPENLSTGYSWRIDPEASDGLDRLAIVDRGHKRGASLPGAPGSHGWTVRALTPGKAAIEFVYQRPWEPTPGQTRWFVIEATP